MKDFFVIFNKNDFSLCFSLSKYQFRPDLIANLSSFSI